MVKFRSVLYRQSPISSQLKGITQELGYAVFYPGISINLGQVNFSYVGNIRKTL